MKLLVTNLTMVSMSIKYFRTGTCRQVDVFTLNGKVLEDSAVPQVAIDVVVPPDTAAAAEVDVVGRVEGAGDGAGGGAAVGRPVAAAAAAVGAGGGGPPVLHVVGGQLAARRRVEGLELGAAREVEGAPVVQAGLAAAAAHAEVGQVLLKGELQKSLGVRIPYSSLL